MRALAPKQLKEIEARHLYDQGYAQIDDRFRIHMDRGLLLDEVKRLHDELIYQDTNPKFRALISFFKNLDTDGRRAILEFAHYLIWRRNYRDNSAPDKIMVIEP